MSYRKLGVDRQITIRNHINLIVTLVEGPFNQIKSIASESISIAYGYRSRYLVKRATTEGSRTLTREYHYEDSRNNSLLTGITDERGIRFATWAYDAQSRGVSSQHSDGAGLTRISYNADGSSELTNELGKKTTYRYQQLSGVKRIVSIEGEPSPNCAASNSSFTYNERGQVLTKVDAKDLITTFTYNDRGLESSRAEASGTALARSVITEWHPVHFLPIKVIELARTTVYSYDDQGRETSGR